MVSTNLLVALATATLLSLGQAHMIMLTPTPFNNETIDNSPLESTGSNFPCKTTGSSDFYNAAGISNSMAIGQPQTLSFRGSAVHGGGSCQLALTTDKAPTPSSSWQVISSIIGGCPSTTGDGPSTYQYTVPDSVKPGDYVFAWTWISKLAGQPEYYMNCAPVTVTAGSKKRSMNKQRRQSSLPQLFVGNLASINQCKTTPGTDPVYPDPGPNVQKPPGTHNYANVPGSNCVPLGATDSSSGGGASGSSSSAPAGGDSSAAAPTSTGKSAPTSPMMTITPVSLVPVPQTDLPAVSSMLSAATSSAPVSADPVSADPASVVPSTGASAAPTEAASVVPSAAASAASTEASAAAPSQALGTAPLAPAATTTSSVIATPAATGAAASASPSSDPNSSPGSGSGGSGGSGGAVGFQSGPCTSEGMWNCMGGTSFQRCASGQWSVSMPVAPGTSCTPGQSMTYGRRQLRYHRPQLKAGVGRW